MKKALLLILVSAVAVLFTTCSEPIDFVDSVATEVKVANDLFLVVESVISPAENETDANPGSQVVVKFDRNVDISTVTDASITITNITDTTSATIQNPSFSTVNRQLIFEPVETGYVGYFKDNHDYTIEISGVRGADNSTLQDPYVWSFHTGTAPAGSISLTDQGGSPAADSGYTNSVNITVSNLSVNATATQYYSSTNEADFDDPGTITGWKNSLTSFTLTLPSGDGQKYVYSIFKNSDGSKYSRVISSAIVLDATAPVVNVGDDVISYASFYRSASVVESNIRSYLWTRPSGPGIVSFSSATKSYTTVYEPSPDGIYYIMLTATDKAGNQGSDTLMYTVDNVPPNAPTVTYGGSLDPTYDTTPYFYWSSGGGGGNGTYQYITYTSNYTTGVTEWGDYTSTSSTTLSPPVSISGIEYALERVLVREYDAAGNVSDWDYDTVAIVSRYLPYNGQTNVPASYTFRWPSIFLPRTTNPYTLQVKNGKLYSDVYSTTHTYYSATGLPAGSTITWRIKSVDARGVITYSSPLTFTTN